jgi:hypothetical protein
MVETIGANGPNVYLAYVSDDGNTYNIRTTQQNATAMGATPVARDANPNLPIGYHVRHVFGAASGGQRTKIPQLTLASGLYVSGGTFSKFGLTFTVEGKIGEKRELL